jgi:hypothetical protein
MINNVFGCDQLLPCCHGHLMNKKNYENYDNDIDLKYQCNKTSNHL